jgi:hypothetical protein
MAANESEGIPKLQSIKLTSYDDQGNGTKE